MRNRKRIIYAVLAFVVVAVIYNLPGQVSLHRKKRDLEKTFQDYSRAIESRQYSSAYAYGDAAFKAAIDPQAFATLQDKFESQFGTLKSVREGEFYIHGRGSPMRWTATVEEVRHYEKGDVHFVCEFNVEDGRWQLFGCKQTD